MGEKGVGVMRGRDDGLVVAVILGGKVLGLRRSFLKTSSSGPNPLILDHGFPARFANSFLAAVF